MHWLKLLMEVWAVFGVVTIVAGMIWTTRLSREMNPEVSRARRRNGSPRPRPYRNYILPSRIPEPEYIHNRDKQR